MALITSGFAQGCARVVGPAAVRGGGVPRQLGGHQRGTGHLRAGAEQDDRCARPKGNGTEEMLSPVLFVFGRLSHTGHVGTLDIVTQRKRHAPPFLTLVAAFPLSTLNHGLISPAAPTGRRPAEGRGPAGGPGVAGARGAGGRRIGAVPGRWGRE